MDEKKLRDDLCLYLCCLQQDGKFSRHHWRLWCCDRWCCLLQVLNNISQRVNYNENEKNNREKGRFYFIHNLLCLERIIYGYMTKGTADFRMFLASGKENYPQSSRLLLTIKLTMILILRHTVTTAYIAECL